MQCVFLTHILLSSLFCVWYHTFYFFNSTEVDFALVFLPFFSTTVHLLCYLLCWVFIAVTRVLSPSSHTRRYTFWSLGGSSVQLKQASQHFQSFCSKLHCFPPKLWRKPNGYLSSRLLWGFVTLQTNVHSSKWSEHSVTVCVCAVRECRSEVSWASMTQLTVFIGCHMSIWSSWCLLSRCLHLYSLRLPFLLHLQIVCHGCNSSSQGLGMAEATLHKYVSKGMKTNIFYGIYTVCTWTIAHL